MAIDGSCLDVADTPANDEYFSRPGAGGRGEKAAFPQARILGLAECATHAVFAATIGGYRDSEAKLAEKLLDALTPDMLLLADRGFFSYALWRKALRPEPTCCGEYAPTPTRHNRCMCRILLTARG